MLSGQAILHMWKGELETARNYCRRPLDVNRGVVTAYKTLAHLLDLRLPDEDVARLREVVGDDATRTADVSRLTIAVVERHPR